MFYGYGFCYKRCCCCASPTGKQPSSSANAERCERSVADAQPADVPSTPKPPPSSPVIQPVHPDLPYLNPSIIREDSTYTV